MGFAVRIWRLLQFDPTPSTCSRAVSADCREWHFATPEIIADDAYPDTISGASWPRFSRLSPISEGDRARLNGEAGPEAKFLTIVTPSQEAGASVVLSLLNNRMLTPGD